MYFIWLSQTKSVKTGYKQIAFEDKKITKNKMNQLIAFYQ